MDVRRQLAEAFRLDGHKVILMEDEQDQADEDLVDKFDRLLGHRGSLMSWCIGLLAPRCRPRTMS